VLTANPEPLAPFFDVELLLGGRRAAAAAFIEPFSAHRERPAAERLRSPAAVPGVYGRRSMPPLQAANGQLVGRSSSDRASGHPARGGPSRTWRGNTLSHSMVITPEAAVALDSTWWKWFAAGPELLPLLPGSYLTLPSAPQP